MSTNKGTWADVLAWAKADIEATRAKLETSKPDQTITLQARVAVMRELLTLNDIPKTAEIPPPVSYA